jgi:hypothetical protein
MYHLNGDATAQDLTEAFAGAGTSGLKLGDVLSFKQNNLS